MSNSNSSIRLICSIDEPSFNKAKEAIRQLRAEVHRLANATDRVNLENMLGRGSSSPGGGFSFSDKAGAKPSDPAMNAKVSGPGKAFVQGLNAYKSQIQGISRLGVTALSELTSAVAHANQSQKRHLDEMTQSVQKLASAYQALGKQSGGLGGGMAPGGAGSPNNRNSQGPGFIGPRQATFAQLASFNKQQASAMAPAAAIPGINPALSTAQQMAVWDAELKARPALRDEKIHREWVEGRQKAESAYQKGMTKVQKEALDIQAGYDSKDAQQIEDDRRAKWTGRMGIAGGIAAAGRAGVALADAYDYTRFAKEDNLAHGAMALHTRRLNNMLSGNWQDEVNLTPNPDAKTLKGKPLAQGSIAIGGGSFKDAYETGKYSGTGAANVRDWSGIVQDVGTAALKITGGALMGAGVPGALVGAGLAIPDLAKAYEKGFGNVAAGSAETREAQNRIHALDVQKANDPIGSAFWSILSSTRDTRVEGARRLKGNVNGFASTGIDQGYTFGQSIENASSDAANWGVDAAGGIFSKANNMARHGIDRGVASSAIGMLSGTVGGLGSQKENAQASSKMLSDAMAIGVTKGFTDPRVSQELAGSLAQATKDATLDPGGDGLRRLATLFSGGGDGSGSRSLRDMQQNAGAVNRIDQQVQGNTYYQQKTTAQIQTMLGEGSNPEKLGALKTASMAELLGGSSILDAEGVTPEERRKAARINAASGFTTELERRSKAGGGDELRAEIAKYGEGSEGMLKFAESQQNWKTDKEAARKHKLLLKVIEPNRDLAPTPAAAEAAIDVLAATNAATGPNAGKADKESFKKATAIYQDVIAEKDLSATEKAKLQIYTDVLKTATKDIIEKLNPEAIMAKIKEDIKAAKNDKGEVEFSTGKRYVVQVIGPDSNLPAGDGPSPQGTRRGAN